MTRNVRPQVLVDVLGYLAESSRGDALEGADQFGDGDFRRVVHEKVDVVGIAVELDRFCSEVGADHPHDLL